MSNTPFAARYAVLDFETTGFSPANGDRCIEVGLVLLEGGQVIDRYSSLMKSDISISKKITQLTGIENSQVKNAPQCEKVMQDLIWLSKGATLVAHNAAFDSRFWRNEVNLATGASDTQEFICTMKLARRLLPKKKSYKLSELGGSYGYNDVDSHRALPDAEVTAKLFLDLMKIAEEKYTEGLSGNEFLLKLQSTPTAKVAKLTNNGSIKLEGSIEKAFVEQVKSTESIKKESVIVPANDQQVELTVAEVLAHIDSENISVDDVETRYYKNGNPSSFRVQLTHEVLDRARSISSKHRDILFSKVSQQILAWNEIVGSMDATRPISSIDFPVNEEVIDSSVSVSMQELQGILKHTLSVNDAVDWGSLKISRAFKAEEKYPELIDYDEFGRPGRPKYQAFDKPYPQKVLFEKPNFEQYQSALSTWESISFQKSKIEEEDRAKYRRALDDWNDNVEKAEVQYQSELRQRENEENLVKKNNNYIDIIFSEELKTWQEGEAAVENELKELNFNVDNLQKRYFDADPDAIEEYCDLVLERSQYPEFWQREATIAYKSESKVVVLDFKLPEIDELPKYRQSHNNGRTQVSGNGPYLTNDERVSLYEEVVTQLMLRTIHELFEADVINSLKKICINGYVVQIDNKNKHISNKIIASMLIEKDHFCSIDLQAVDSVACYREHGGRGRFIGEAYWTIDPYIEVSEVVLDSADAEAVLRSGSRESRTSAELPGLPPLNTRIDKVKISPEIDQFVRQLYNLTCNRSSDIKIENTLNAIIKLDESDAKKIPNVGPIKLSQLRCLQQLYAGIDDEATQFSECHDNDVSQSLEPMSIDLSAVELKESALDNSEKRVFRLLKLRMRGLTTSDLLNLDVDKPMRGLVLGERNKGIVTTLKMKLAAELKDVFLKGSSQEVHNGQYLICNTGARDMEPILCGLDELDLLLSSPVARQETSIVTTNATTDHSLESPGPSSSEANISQKDAVEFTEYPHQLLKLLETHKQPPVVGGDVLNGDVVAGALEWQWPESKVGFSDGLKEKEIKQLIAMGWKLVTGCEDEDINQLVVWLDASSNISIH